MAKWKDSTIAKIKQVLIKILLIISYEDSTKLVTGIEIVDDDDLVQKLNQEIQDMYSSYYKFDHKDMPCFFDTEQEKMDKDKMLNLLEKLINRLKEINDGSYVIEDKETERMKAL